MNRKRIQNMLLVLFVVSIIFIIGAIFVKFVYFSFRVLLFILMFSVLGLLNARISIKMNDSIIECIKANTIIILILMFSTRIAYAIALATVEPFDILNLLSCFVVYFVISSIVSLVVYFLEGELDEFL